jgi:hypothetical protein
MYKIDKIGNQILIEKGPHWWNICIWGKEIKFLIDKDSMWIFEGLINLVKDLIVKQISFWSQFGC